MPEPAAACLSDSDDPLLAAWKARRSGERLAFVRRLVGINARLDELIERPMPSPRFVVHKLPSAIESARTV